MLACRQEPDRVRGLAAGHEADGGVSGDAEEILQPDARGLLGHRSRRRGHRVEADLIPSRREQIRTHGGVDRPTDHEAEEAWPRGRDQPGCRGSLQLVEDLGGVDGIVGQRPVERCSQLVEVDHRMDARFREAGAVAGDRTGRATDQVRQGVLRR